MDKEILGTIKKFDDDISKILKVDILDILIHGSTVSGGFIKGKGDIDFTVLTKSIISEEQTQQIFQLHRNYRRSKSLARQLEGCYYSVDPESKEINGGVYIGTNEKRWRTLYKLEHNNIGIAEIQQNHYSTRNSGIREIVFKWTWEEVDRELKEQSKNNLKYLDETNDYSFKIYAIYTGARSLYTMETKGFISKSEALKWISRKDIYTKYEDLINECSKLRNPLSESEIQTINEEKFENIKDFLTQIDKDIQRQTIR